MTSEGQHAGRTPAEATSGDGEAPLFRDTGSPGHPDGTAPGSSLRESSDGFPPDLGDPHAALPRRAPQRPPATDSWAPGAPHAYGPPPYPEPATGSPFVVPAVPSPAPAAPPPSVPGASTSISASTSASAGVPAAASAPPPVPPPPAAAGFRPAASAPPPVSPGFQSGSPPDGTASAADALPRRSPQDDAAPQLTLAPNGGALPRRGDRPGSSLAQPQPWAASEAFAPQSARSRAGAQPPPGPAGSDHAASGGPGLGGAQLGAVAAPGPGAPAPARPADEPGTAFGAGRTDDDVRGSAAPPQRAGAIGSASAGRASVPVPGGAQRPGHGYDGGRPDADPAPEHGGHRDEHRFPADRLSGEHSGPAGGPLESRPRPSITPDRSSGSVVPAPALPAFPPPTILPPGPLSPARPAATDGSGPSGDRLDTPPDRPEGISAFGGQRVRVPGATLAGLTDAPAYQSPADNGSRPDEGAGRFSAGGRSGELPLRQPDGRYAMPQDADPGDDAAPRAGEAGVPAPRTPVSPTSAAGSPAAPQSGDGSPAAPRSGGAAASASVPTPNRVAPPPNGDDRAAGPAAAPPRARVYGRPVEPATPDHPADRADSDPSGAGRARLDRPVSGRPAPEADEWSLPDPVPGGGWAAADGPDADRPDADRPGATGLDRPASGGRALPDGQNAGHPDTAGRPDTAGHRPPVARATASARVAAPPPPVDGPAGTPPVSGGPGGFPFDDPFRRPPRTGASAVNGNHPYGEYTTDVAGRLRGTPPDPSAPAAGGSDPFASLSRSGGSDLEERGGSGPDQRGGFAPDQPGGSGPDQSRGFAADQPRGFGPGQPGAFGAGSSGAFVGEQPGGPQLPPFAEQTSDLAGRAAASGRAGATPGGPGAGAGPAAGAAGSSSPARASVAPPAPHETSSWPAADPEQGRFDQFKAEAPAEKAEAPPKPIRKLPVVLAVLAAAVLLVALPMSIVWLMARPSGDAFTVDVGECVKKDGQVAVRAACGEVGAFQVVSKADTAEQCPDPGMPFVENPTGGGRTQVLCLKRATA